jgi:7-cyano-7-deazaguanine reductase
MDQSVLQHTPLGKKVDYSASYSPELLSPVPRVVARQTLQITEPRPFRGVDIWNAYELSWLNPQGKPQIAMAEFWVPDSSTYIFESKSLKLYLNSFSRTSFASVDKVKETLQKDLSQVTKGEVTVKLILPELFSRQKMSEFSGQCLDHLNTNITSYQINPDFLTTAHVHATEAVYSHLFRSNCPITQQPDWASIWIQYQGKKIQHEGLLKYIISFRENNEFHEHCAERIFMDIMRRCEPKKLTVYMRFTRRGGIDINPFRSNFKDYPKNIRTFQQ